MYFLHIDSSDFDIDIYMGETVAEVVADFEESTGANLAEYADVAVMYHAPYEGVQAEIVEAVKFPGFEDSDDE